MKRIYWLIPIPVLTGAAYLATRWIRPAGPPLAHPGTDTEEMAMPATARDGLLWLKSEFKLSDADYTRISNLHDACLPGCMERCKEIARVRVALDAIMERHQTRLLHWLVRLTGCEASAGDIAQDAFVRVFEKRHQFKPGAQFSNWLYTVAANLVRDAKRLQSRHPHLSLESESSPGAGDSLSNRLVERSPDPARACETEERAVAVRRASPPCRKACGSP